MSWKTINEILGLASVDQEFRQEFLTNPLDSVLAKGFDLNVQEQVILRTLKAKTLQEMSQLLLAHFQPDA